MLFHIGVGDIFYMLKFNWASLLDIAAQKTLADPVKKVLNALIWFREKVTKM